MNIFRKKEIDYARVPKHVALIMDGNGRWARKRGLPRTKGHEEGAKRMTDLVKSAKEMGITALTFFAFSTENWKRPKEEVDYIFSLLKKLLRENKQKFQEDDVKLTFIGHIDKLDDEIKDLIYDAIESTKNNTSITLCIALNYGSRSEIVKMVKDISSDCVNKKIKVDDIDEKLIDKYMMTKDLPEIDLMIRTSGEIRLSNFLLWQLAYSELIFTKTYWPDFDDKCLRKCVIEFQGRNRRFGGLKK